MKAHEANTRPNIHIRQVYTGTTMDGSITPGLGLNPISIGCHILGHRSTRYANWCVHAHSQFRGKNGGRGGAFSVSCAAVQGIPTTAVGRNRKY